MRKTYFETSKIEKELEKITMINISIVFFPEPGRTDDSRDRRTISGRKKPLKTKHLKEQMLKNLFLSYFLGMFGRCLEGFGKVFGGFLGGFWEEKTLKKR